MFSGLGMNNIFSPKVYFIFLCCALWSTPRNEHRRIEGFERERSPIDLWCGNFDCLFSILHLMVWQTQRSVAWLLIEIVAPNVLVASKGKPNNNFDEQNKRVCVRKIESEMLIFWTIWIVLNKQSLNGRFI